MRGYAATEMFERAEVRLWERATVLVERVPEDWEVRCHELARAVGRLLDLDVVDGKFGAVEHSWLVLPPRHVLDVYTPGVVPLVTLRDLHWGLPDTPLYKPGDPRDDIEDKVVDNLAWVMTHGYERVGPGPRDRVAVEYVP